MSAPPRGLVLVSTSFPESGDGSEAAGAFVRDFAGELSRHAPVHVVAPGRAAGREQVSGTLLVERFAVPRQPLSRLEAWNPAHWRAILATLRAGAAAVESAAAQRPRHILALWALPSGAWARRVGVPYSVWALGSDIWSLGRVPVVRGVLRSVLAEAQFRFADGHALADAVTRLAGRPCRFLPSARVLPPRSKQLAQAPPYKLAFLGRWHPNKGVDLLLESLALLAEDDWRRIEAVRIAGGGALEPLVRAQAARLASAGRPVTVEGFLDAEGAATLLAWADWVVIPSRIESIPVVFSDALQARCPVVATPVGDLPRLLQDAALGALAAAASPAGLARALGEALRGPSPEARHAALERAATGFGVPRIAQEFLRVTGLAEAVP